MRHTLWCRLIMALAARRVCTCGASPRPSKQQLRRRVSRKRETGDYLAAQRERQRRQRVET